MALDRDLELFHEDLCGMAPTMKARHFSTIQHVLVLLYAICNLQWASSGNLHRCRGSCFSKLKFQWPVRLPSHVKMWKTMVKNPAKLTKHRVASGVGFGNQEYS